MNSTDNRVEKKSNQNVLNFTLVAIAGQVGCLTILIVVIALFSGLWLDNRFQTRPMFTIGLVISSIPVTLLAMLWVVKFTTSHMRQVKSQKDSQVAEERNSG
jgi:ABC-type transport system involved in cytochrome c biogenesis permease subunit